MSHHDTQPRGCVPPASFSRQYSTGEWQKHSKEAFWSHLLLFIALHSVVELHNYTVHGRQTSTRAKVLYNVMYIIIVLYSVDLGKSYRTSPRLATPYVCKTSCIFCTCKLQVDLRRWAASLGNSEHACLPDLIRARKEAHHRHVSKVENKWTGGQESVIGPASWAKPHARNAVPASWPRFGILSLTVAAVQAGRFQKLFGWSGSIAACTCMLPSAAHHGPCIASIMWAVWRQ